jgi:hypothetical protein
VPRQKTFIEMNRIISRKFVQSTSVREVCGSNLRRKTDYPIIFHESQPLEAYATLEIYITRRFVPSTFLFSSSLFNAIRLFDVIYRESLTAS